MSRYASKSINSLEDKTMKEAAMFFCLIALTLLQEAGAQSPIKVVTTFSDFASIVREVGGDKVTVELSPYDLTRGRITYRSK